MPLVARRTRHLPVRDLAVIRGIPVTSVARTLLDLAAVLSETALRRAFIEADRLGLIVDEDLRDCSSRTRGHRGAGAFLRLASSRLPEASRLRSVLEGMFLELCREYRIELPEVNVMVGGFEVDCVWRSSRLVVELDGYRYHAGQEKFESDADRISELRANGWSTMRITWRMVDERPEAVAARVKRALAAPSPGHDT